MSLIDLVVQSAQWKGEAVDVFISGGRIKELAPAGREPVSESVQAVDAKGLVLLPSLTDVHTHLREPGFEYKEDIASGLAAAAQGGFGQVMAMANTNPVNDTASVTEHMLRQAQAVHPDGPRLYPIGALTRGLQGKELAPLAELAESGCQAFSNDGLPVLDTELFRRAVEYASDLGRIVIDHCEDPFMKPAAGINEGVVSSELGLAGQPDAGEAIQAARDILLAEYLDLPLHLAHISSAKSVELIAGAKRRGIKVTAETCPHYLVFTEEEVRGYNTAAKVNPPLRTQQDVLAVRQALREGVIDILATDHAPHARHEKEVEFDQAPCGVSGLDTALSVTWALVKEGELSLDDFLRAWSSGPCKIFGLDCNGFAPGDPADFLLFDPEAEWEVTPGAMLSKGKNTPLLGRVLTGRVRSHFLLGRNIVPSR
ncbi:MAG: dihydroorotase [Desulfovibrionales bacterium]|jgi:dihydroorotase|nr:dihydroorotase [Desulfovibrionales bacterium]